MPDRSNDFSLEDTYQWLKKEFTGLHSLPDLVAGITEVLARAYKNGKDDGLATAAELVIEDIRGRGE